MKYNHVHVGKVYKITHPLHSFTGQSVRVKSKQHGNIQIELPNKNVVNISASHLSVE